MTSLALSPKRRASSMARSIRLRGTMRVGCNSMYSFDAMPNTGRTSTP